MENALNLITGLVEWQGAELHESKRGKLKPVAKGIPNMRFKATWRAHKASLMAAGVRLAVRDRKASSGQYVIRRGKAKEVCRNQWEVVLWLNRHNWGQAVAAGIPVPELPETESQKKLNRDTDPF